ncbi:MAG: barstar family protein [Clostridia bacterium]|nr:barstar family protein [Clostridia bacterium]
MTTVIIDGSAVKSHEDIHTIFETSLKLPPWYGRNLDALYDCLTDMSESVTIQLKNLPALEAAMGARYPALLRMLYDASEENHRITIRETNEDKDDLKGEKFP